MNTHTKKKEENKIKIKLINDTNMNLSDSFVYLGSSTGRHGILLQYNINMCIIIYVYEMEVAEMGLHKIYIITFVSHGGHGTPDSYRI